MIVKPFTHDEYAEIGELFIDSLGAMQMLGHRQPHGIQAYVPHTGECFHDVVLDAMICGETKQAGTDARARVEAWLWDHDVPPYIAAKISGEPIEARQR